MPLSLHALTDDERSVLRGRLAARMRALRGELRDALHGDDPATAHLPNRRGDLDDDAVADLETALDVASIERDARELSEVAAALQRLERPDFGRCVECAEPIAWPRLLAVPQARRCIGCEQQATRGFTAARL